MVEIERKFLVTSDDYKLQSFSQNRISQGYLNSHPERSVRIRICGESGLLTIKGKSNESGNTRFEWETEISLTDARKLIELCEPGIIDKIRYKVAFGEHVFEIDEFLGDNDGLVVAEVELRNEDDSFDRPEWLGEEVTGVIKYYNASLVSNPFKNW
ncbi:MAG: CYTH domain-containing protein [Flavobacterium sp.]|nr:CYTH domain-containing protein [Flavobacterium sp.]